MLKYIVYTGVAALIVSDPHLSAGRACPYLSAGGASPYLPPPQLPRVSREAVALPGGVRPARWGAIATAHSGAVERGAGSGWL